MLLGNIGVTALANLLQKIQKMYSACLRINLPTLIWLQIGFGVCALTSDVLCALLTEMQQ